tara:strand:- start:2876 stop:3811 length:936 start_codon:yes stop_codon:yes gene_type:complete
MKNNNRIVFMGTPDIAADYLYTLINNNYNVIATYTQPAKPKDRGMSLKSSPVEDLSNKNNIPCFTPKSFNDEKEIDKFKDLRIDIAIIIGYGILLPKKLINIPKFGCINIHLSLLPRWRGASPIEYALLNGDKETGVTIFKLNEKFDQGPIINSKKCSIRVDITKEELHENLKKIGINLLLSTLPKYFNDEINLKIQNENYATYAKKIFSKNRKIDFSKDKNEIYNRIRSFSPSPGAWFTYKNERIKIISCEVKSLIGEHSTILSKDLIIACNDGSIKPKIIQKEGKKSMKIEEFVRGFIFKVGDKINTDE